MIKNILTIAGTDPTGGAGIQADIKTFSAMRTYGMSVITAVVAQNTCGVRSFKALDPSFVADQIDAVFDDVDVHAVKIGMVANAAIAKTIADRLKHHRAYPVVLDPVMVAKSNDLLLEPDAIEAMRDELIPISTVITPNLPEAGILLGREAPKTIEEMHAIVEDLRALKSEWVLLKGGRLHSAESVDILHGSGITRELHAPRVATNNVHGTGCTLAAAIAALISRMSVQESVQEAKNYLHNALFESRQLHVGKGRGPVHHFYELWRMKK